MFLFQIGKQEIEGQAVWNGNGKAKEKNKEGGLNTEGRAAQTITITANKNMLTSIEMYL